MQTLDDLGRRRPRRSKAWIYYALLAVGAVIGTFTQPLLVLAAFPLAAYSRYLYRGGSVVIWFW